MISMSCAAASRSGGRVSLVIGSGRSPKCTAALLASEKMNATKLTCRATRSELSSRMRSVPYASSTAWTDTAGGALRSPRGHHADAAQSGRLPVGSRTDAALAAAVRPRRDLRAARRARSRRPDALREELGDFLFEAVFLAQIAEEDGHFSIGDAVAGHHRQAGPAPSARLHARRPPARRGARGDDVGDGGREVGGPEGAGAQARRAARRRRS